MRKSRSQHCMKSRKCMRYCDTPASMYTTPKRIHSGSPKGEVPEVA